MFKKIKSLFSKKELRKLYFLTIFSVFISFSEVFGLSIIIPFISLASNRKILNENIYLYKFYKFLNFSTYKEFVIFLGISIIIIFILKNILNIIFNFCLVNFARNNYYKITSGLLRRYLEYPYKSFINKNTNVMNKNITTECNLLLVLIQAFLLLLSEVIVIIAIYFVMLLVNLKITLLVTLFLGLNLFFIKKLIINKTKKWGIERAKSMESYYKIVGSVLGNYKFIKLLGDIEKTCNSFEDVCEKYVEVDKKYQITQPIPRYILETLGFIIVILLIINAIVFYGEEGIKEVMPLITAFFLGLYRILPSINRSISYYQNIIYYKQSLFIISEEMKEETETLGDKNISFDKLIELKNITFEYEKNKEIIKNISLKIRKTEKVAFIGESGSGKTTLVDLIIGLYTPKNGEILIDNNVLSKSNLKKWRSYIGYIPQEVYLFDGTVEDNVVFGREYNNKKLEIALKKARIWDFLQTKNGVKTKVGDKGVMLSGGQKQRLAIARALYTNPEILVLDEATSALDNKIEKEIMDEIYQITENKTLLIIAHRLSTLEKCNKIFMLKDGKIKKIINNIEEISTN